MPDELIQDLYAGLSHRPLLTGNGDETLAAPRYHQGESARRLNAYQILRSLMDCTARWGLAENDDRPDQADEWREFGDPATFVAQLAAGILGDGQTIVVEGADNPPPDEPDIGQPPEPPPTDPPEGEHPLVTQLRSQVYEQAVAAWTEQAQAAFDEWMQARADYPKRVAAQRRLRSWAETVHLEALLAESEEEHVVPLGDGIWVVSWDYRNRRPKVTIYEPDVYVPDLADVEPGEFPTTVHLVWNFMARPPGSEDDPKAEEEEWVRRITYELVPKAEAVEAAAAHGLTLGPPPYLVDTAAWSEGCLVTDATFPAGSFETAEGPNPDGRYRTEPADPAVPEEEGGDVIVWNRRPLDVDFLPVVHVPHTPSSTTHFGRSPLVRACQLFDEIAGSDVEQSLCARWSARPVVGVSGMTGGTSDSTVPLNPGDGIRLSQDGRMSKVDMADGLPALLDHVEQRRKLAGTVMAVPDGLVGRVDASEIPSGVALQLTFTPWQRVTLKARMVRDVKWALLLKMVQRFSIAYEDEAFEGDTEVYPARIVPGPFMPEDLAGDAAWIARLLEARAISQSTAIRMLIARGVPAEHAEAELARIRAVMADTADQITAATENPVLGGKFLGYTDAELEPSEDAPEGEDGGAPAPAEGALFV